LTLIEHILGLKEETKKKSSVSDEPVIDALVQQIASLCATIQSLPNKFIKLEREQHASSNSKQPFNHQKKLVPNKKAKRLDGSLASTLII
jgi:hypothetical protein